MLHVNDVPGLNETIVKGDTNSFWVQGGILTQDELTLCWFDSFICQ